MAKIQSPFEIRGSVGNMTYFKNEYGQQIKEKGGPTEWQVKNLERFTNTRHNAAEWKSATAASRLVRHAMGISLLHSVNNIRLSGRMNGRLLAAIHGDLVNDYGERRVSAGNLSALSGFEFNHKLSLEDALPLNMENCFSIEAGKLAVDIPAFRIRKKKSLPADATHYRLVSCILTIDFDKRTYHQENCVSALHTVGRQAGAAFSIEQVVQPVNEQGCYWLMGVEFYRLENEHPVLVRGGALRVMEWIPSEPGFIGLNGLGGSIDRVEEVLQEVVVEQAGASAVAAKSSTEGVGATACEEEKKPAEAGVEEVDTLYWDIMEQVLDTAYVEGAKFVEALADYAMVDEVAGSGDLPGGIEEEVDEALASDAVEFEPSLRVLLTVEGYRQREVLKSEVLVDSTQVGTYPDKKFPEFVPLFHSRSS